MMSKKEIFGLFILWIFVLIYKYILHEELGHFISVVLNINIDIYDITVYHVTKFCAIFLFPFLLCIFFWMRYKKYQNNYGEIAQWTLKILIILAVYSSLGGFFWLVAIWGKYFLLDLLGAMAFYEVYLSISLFLLLICLFILGFGKKPIES